MDTMKGRGCVFSLEYHIVWCTKYRKKIISGPIESELVSILCSYASSHRFGILECNTDKDHIHLLVWLTPQHYIPEIIQGMKGSSARKLFMTFPFLKKELWGGHLWNPSYYIATVSENTERQIKEYIQNQKEDGHEKKRSQKNKNYEGRERSQR